MYSELFIEDDTLNYFQIQCAGFVKCPFLFKQALLSIAKEHMQKCDVLCCPQACMEETIKP